tara:strand:+ start:418 stop:1704 length:1287 start_codon:yes stop_codon:yes gene_type:complete
MKKTFLEFLTEKGINDLKEVAVEKQGELYTEYISETIKSLDSAIKDNATKEELEAMRKDINDAAVKNTDVTNNILKTQGKAIKEALDKLTVSAPVSEFKSIEEQLIENKDILTRMKAGEKKLSFTIKAVGDMGNQTSPSSNVTGDVPQAERISGLNTIASREVRFLDGLQAGSIASNLVEWVYQSGKDGAAGSTAEGILKNQIDFDMVVASQRVEKQSAFITITDEMLEDIPFMASEVNGELMRELSKAVEASAFGGSGTSPELNGVNTVATAWAAGTFATSVANPNIVDVLRVGVNQIALAEQEAPTAIWMHPSDVTTLQLTKSNATQNLYATELALIAGQLMLDGIPIYKSTLVTADNFLMGDFTKANMRTRKGMTIEVGMINDNFTKNYKTILAEWRGVVYVKNNDRTSFVKGVFSTSIAALTAP